MKTRVSLKYFVIDCLWRHFFASILLQTPQSLILLTIVVILRPFTQFQPKIRASNMQKSAKIFFTQ